MLQRFERRHPQRFERLQSGFEDRTLGHAIGMKLLEDPLLQADLFDARDIARSRAEGEAIERVQDLVVLRKLLLEQLTVGGWLRFSGFRDGWETENDGAEGWGQESTAGFHEPITIKRHSGSEVYDDLHLAL